MDAARWERIQDLFHRAIELPEPERRSFLDRECSADPSLAEAVLSMLEEDARGGSMLDRDLAGFAHRVLDGEEASAVPTDRFGPYRATKLLGEGGMGVVFLAERDDLGSVAAVKILRDATLSPARRERFASEQRTLAQLNHPSIARLYDAGTLAEGTPWIVMEYVAGVPLTAYCDARESSIAERLRLFRAVCEAVQHAHGHAIIHRDLKPSNILVRVDGTVKLLDFGIAKQLEAQDGAAHLTRTTWRPLTPAYAAPEQVRGGAVGIHTDIYSLGAILYELLAGRPPHDLSERTPGEAEKIIAEQEPPPPSSVAREAARSPGASRIPTASRDAWADLVGLCLTALHKDPRRRYATADALIRDIDHYLEGEPLEARPDSVRYRTGKFLRRNWRPVTIAAVVLAVLVGVVGFYTVRLRTARNTALEEAARTQRIQRFMLSLFQGGDEEAGPAESLGVVTMLDRGVLEARALAAEPAVQEELFQTLGGIYETLGELGRADSLLRQALEQRRARLGPRHPDVARSLVALGLLRSSQARYDEAERLAREGLEQTRSRKPPDARSLGQALAALGHVLEGRGRYDEAVVVLGEAIEVQRGIGGDETDLASSLYELANTHFYAGHYAASDSLNRQVMEITRRVKGDRHPSISDALINLGAVQFEQGRYVEAEGYYPQALDITRSWYGEQHPKTASNLTMLGRALVFQSRFDEATAALRQSMAIRERVFGPAHPAVASTVNEIGNGALQTQRFDDAEAAFRRMVEIYRTVYGDRHYLMGTALSNLGSVYMKKEDHPRAEPFFRRALAVYTQTLPADHLNVGIARIKLGRTMLRQRRYAEAERETRAGYEILTRQTDPAVSWLKAARTDLAEAYDALKQPDKAAAVREEQSKSESPQPKSE